MCTHICVWMSVCLWVVNVRLWAALQSVIMTVLEGTCTGIWGRAAVTSQVPVWRVPSLPGTRLPRAQAQPPHRGWQGLWAASFSSALCPGLASSCLTWAAQASCCLSISLGCRSVVIFSYQRPLTQKRNQARVRYKNQLDLRTIFPWKITKELNNSAF